MLKESESVVDILGKEEVEWAVCTLLCFAVSSFCFIGSDRERNAGT